MLEMCGRFVHCWQRALPAVESDKQAMNHVAQTDAALAKRVVRLDTELADALLSRVRAREVARLFPTVTVRGVKG